MNPLGAISNAAATVNAVQQNKLTGQTLAARNSLSNIISQSTNPDGSINYANAKALAANDPNSALITPELQSQNLAANSPIHYYDTAKGQDMVVPAQNAGNQFNPQGNQVKNAPMPGITPNPGGYQGNPNVAGGPAIGTDQALSESGEFSAPAKAANDALPPLRRALAIAKNSDFNSGNLEPAIAEIYGKLSDAGLATKGATDQASMMQEMKKYLAQSLQGSAATDTDMQKFLNSANATPNAGMLKDALTNTLQSTIAQNQAAIVKNGYMAQQNPRDLQGVRNAKQQLNNSVDSRIIQLEIATPEESKALITKFKASGELPSLMAKYKQMESMGLLKNLP